MFVIIRNRFQHFVACRQNERVFVPRRLCAQISYDMGQLLYSWVAIVYSGADVEVQLKYAWKIVKKPKELTLTRLVSDKVLRDCGMYLFKQFNVFGTQVANRLKSVVFEYDEVAFVITRMPIDAKQPVCVVYKHGFNFLVESCID